MDALEDEFADCSCLVGLTGTSESLVLVLQRLAGLDNMILKISAPSKLPTILSNHTLDHDPCINAKKLKKCKPQRANRPPLADKTSSNQAALFPPTKETVISPMVLTISCCPASESLAPPEKPQTQHSTSSLPASTLFRTSSTPVSSHRRVVIRKSKNNKVYEGPHWIPAFHHPNSPYVPWTPSVRQRILPPSSPQSSSPVFPSPDLSRSGAIAPEPWASDTFSDIPKKSAKEKLSSSWKSLKHSIKKGVKNPRHAAIHATNTVPLSYTYSIRHPPPARTFPPDLRAHAPATRWHHSSPPDSKTLANWLTDRRTTAPEVADDSPEEMSVEEYELMGSWLDLRLGDGEWICGVKDCELHAPDGSPNVMVEHFKMFQTAMPFDSPDLLLTRTQPRPPLPSFSSDVLATPSRGGNTRLPERGEMFNKQEIPRLSMPGGWTFS
ncbi:hypothetical protein BU15DRAFT_59771 [Melanogaster broomeanus]|nr:hypothetical protein BU15DRAFT_59771 [Melanogaster broomeanus]